MKNKKPGDLTFQEWLKDENTKQFIYAILKEEEFTKEQIDLMKMEKVWQLFFDATRDNMDRVFSEMFYLIKNVKRDSEARHALNKLIEDMTKTIQDARRELEKREG